MISNFEERSMDADNYLVLAQEALGILKIKYSRSESLESMLTKLKRAIILPADTLEGEIMILNREIAAMIEDEADSKAIESLLNKLATKVNENLFD